MKKNLMFWEWIDGGNWPQIKLSEGSRLKKLWPALGCCVVEKKSTVQSQKSGKPSKSGKPKWQISQKFEYSFISILER